MEAGYCEDGKKIGCHAAAPCGRHVRRRPRRRGGWLQAGQRGWLLDPVRGLHLGADRAQVHDGRHAAARVSRRARPRLLLGDDPGRGARAHAPHRRPLRPAQGHRALPAGHQAASLVGDARRGKVLRVLRRRARLQHPGPPLPGRHPLHEGARGGLPRGGGRDGASDPHHAGAGRHPRLLHGAGRDRVGAGDAAAPHARLRHKDRRAHRPPHLRQPAVRHAGKDLRADAARRAQGGARDQHRRDVDHHRQHHLCHRPGLQQDELVQPPHLDGVAHRHAGRKVVREPARRPRGPRRPRQVLPAVHQVGPT